MEDRQHFVFGVTVDLPASGRVFAGWYEHHELNRGNIVSVFEYAPSYLTTPGSYNLSPAELEFRTGPQPSRVHDYEWGHSYAKHTWPHLFIQDTLPDGWGRNVLAAAGFGSCTHLGERGEAFLLIGTLDAARQGALRLWLDGEPVRSEPLPEVADVPWAEVAQAGASGEWPSNPELVSLLAQGAGQGGAYPKLSFMQEGRSRLAILPRRDHPMSVAREWVAMQLARDCGIRVPRSELQLHDGHAVLMVDRFDRVADSRLGYASARTLRGWSHNSDHGSYETIADLARIHSQYPEANCRELFTRMVFSTLIGGSSAMLNHGFLRAGDRWALSPAFGLMLSQRATGAGGLDYTELCDVAPRFLLSRQEAVEAANGAVQAVREGWEEYAEQAGLDGREAAAWAQRLT